MRVKGLTDKRQVDKNTEEQKLTSTHGLNKNNTKMTTLNRDFLDTNKICMTCMHSVCYRCRENPDKDIDKLKEDTWHNSQD